VPATIERIAEIATRLAEARATRHPIARILTRENASLDDGYAVQRALAARVHADGGVLCGYKVGVTSPAAMARAGVDEPLFGFLEGRDAIANGGTIDMEQLIAPRIEMELAFVLGSDLGGADCDEARALAATAYVVPAFEIIDARYVAGPFDPIAAAADDMSSARHILGTTRLDPRVVALPAVTATLKKNGAEIADGSGADVMGDPVRSLAWLVRTLARWEIRVPAGSVVLTGGFADAVPARAGETFVAEFMPGGSVACTFAGGSRPR
jgi:2-keto-4-pentenoate hydratase